MTYLVSSGTLNLNPINQSITCNRIMSVVTVLYRQDSYLPSSLLSYYVAVAVLVVSAAAAAAVARDKIYFVHR